MDDDFQDLEAELGRLRPAVPNPRLLLRIGQELAPRRRAGRGWLWAPVAAAAALAAAAVLWPRWAVPPAREAPVLRPAAAPALRPVAVRDVLVGSRDEGYVVLADGWPAHRLREAHLDTIVWRDPRSAASLQWSVPREEIRIVPVNFQ
ncbi:MAG TPA: hypothetical protein VN775_13200 [Opitutaceae bacterium]|nr:hypothetical protein [Opitutaceae bacterium]